ncbi:MAG: energy transducer TonB [Campylobacterota bacterium]|nr:energy transducer TonB [Campylobacterota bacterium]
MSKFRYSFSFLLTFMLYALLGFSYLTLLNASKPIEKPKTSVIKIAMVTPPVPKKIETPIIIPPKSKPKPKPKPKPKKIVKKIKPKPKPKKIVKKIKPKPKPKKKVIPKPKPKIKEIWSEPIVNTAPTPQTIVTTTPLQSPIPKVDLDAKKRVFLSKIRDAIHANKKYPKMAKRRNIQGTVHAIFDIQSNGTATNIRLSGASSVLQKAVRKSILRSFPTSIPLELRSKFPMLDVSVNVDFVLE